MRRKLLNRGFQGKTQTISFSNTDKLAEIKSVDTLKSFVSKSIKIRFVLPKRQGVYCNSEWDIHSPLPLD